MTTRMESFKEKLFWAVIILILVGPLLTAIIGPGLFYDYIARQNPPGTPVKPNATKNMYYAAMFYSFRLDDKRAKEIYHELIEDWYYNDLDREIPEDDPWVGLAMNEYANILWGERRRQVALEYLKEFVDKWDGHPQVDQKKIEEARVKMRVYHSGG